MYGSVKCFSLQKKIVKNKIKIDPKKKFFQSLIILFINK
jgi:hypothetical protein